MLRTGDLAALQHEREMLETQLAVLNASEPLQTQGLQERIAGLVQQLAELQGDRRSRTTQARLAAESYAAADTLVFQYLGNTLSLGMEARLFHHLIRLPLSYFQKRNVGDLLQRSMRWSRSSR